MTIASVNVTIQLALPQGWTKEEIHERVVDLLAEHIAGQRGVVEFEVGEVVVNADPFGSALCNQKHLTAPSITAGGIGQAFPGGLLGPLRFNNW